MNKLKTMLRASTKRLLKKFENVEWVRVVSYGVTKHDKDNQYAFIPFAFATFGFIVYETKETRIRHTYGMIRKQNPKILL